MPFYRKIPVVIEAVQYDGDNAAEILNWVTEQEGREGAGAVGAIQREGALFIRTLEGDMKASPSDFIICGVEGEFYPCRADIFEQTYEVVDDVYEVLEAFEARRVDL